MVKFSDGYSSDIENGVVLKLEEQLRSYKSSLFNETYKFVKTPRGEIAVGAKVHIDTGSNSKLLNNEPVLIEFSSIDNIEYSKISIYPDRIDFPFECFPHINFPIDNMPPSLCLTREDFSDWYSEHTFGDLINLINEWFSDANDGNLIKLKDGDYYEPFRHHNTKELLFKVPIEENYIERFKQSGFFVTPIFRLDKKLEVYSDANYSNSPIDALKILLYRDARIVLQKWFIEYPQTFGELHKFLRENGFVFDFENMIKQDNNYSNDIQKLIIQIAFVRPVRVLNKSSRVDSLYFSINLKELQLKGRETPVSEVMVQDHATVELAQYISSTPKSFDNKKVLILGCGAIGSKIAYHLYRSGICNLTLCDNDIMSSHNVVRHALTHSGIFDYKVDMVKADLDRMFRFSKDIVTAIKEDIIQWLPKQELANFDLVIDATASASVLHTLSRLVEKHTIPVVRFALSDGGNVGLTYVNYDRNCNLTDYYMCLVMNAAKHDEDLTEWMNKERTFNYDRVRVGEGCHSNTMILSDDVISTHSGIASSIIRNIFNKQEKKNAAYLSFSNIEYIGQVFTTEYEMPNFISLSCENENSWKTRFPKTLFSEIRHIAKIAGHKEIGGYLLGAVDIKHKTIFILDNFESKSSVGSNNQFKLSKDGWKEYYNQIQKWTCNNMMYIGDWHSHPIGSLYQSETDKATNRNVISKEIETQFGVCIITNSKSTKAYLLKPIDC